MISDGDLMAYLDGERLPHVEQALAASASLRQELEELRQAEGLFRRLFGGVARPTPEDMVDVALGQATPAQRLRVAAFEQQSVAGRREMDELRAEWAETTPARRPRVAQFFAVPLQAMGVRGAGDEHAYHVATLQAQITLRIVPPVGERWGIEGRLKRAEEPLAHTRVTLRGVRARPRPRQTDEQGFFSFPRLGPGVYQLRAYLEQGVIVVPEIRLDE